MTVPPGRPQADEHAAYYAPYIALVPDGDIIGALADQHRTTQLRLAAVTEAQGAFRYAEGKWSVKEVLLHVADAERIFAYRLLRVARGDATPLAGFDENAYAVAAGCEARSMADVAAEFSTVRAATLSLVAGLPPEAWGRRGTANNYPVSVRALAYVIAGHELHHLQVLRERYGA